ncbi:MAG: zinc ribbon domain-containing protein, partial [Campylobacterales bacterium]
CLWINNLKLSDRIWACPVSKTTHNRDYNATINLLKEGLKQVEVKRSDFIPVEVALEGSVCRD